MKIEELMSKKIKSINVSASLHDAAEIMWKSDCGALPVLDNKELLAGMVTDRDIAMAAFTQGRALQEIPLKEVMSKTPAFCLQDDELQAAENSMQKHKVRRLPILDAKSKKVVGIISLNDIALAYKAKGEKVKAAEVADTLASICEHRKSSQTPAAA